MRAPFVVIAALALAATARAQTPAGFNLGDLYCYAAKAYDGAPFYGILRIDPLTGATATTLKITISSSHFVYDPARDRIVFYGRLLGAFNSYMHLVTANGTVTASIALPWTAISFTPGANGKLYVSTPTGPNGIHWFNANNVTTPLKDAGGVANFTYGGTAFEAIHYDAGTNALFAIQASAATACGQPSLSTEKVVRIPLSPDGTKVGGAIAESQFCLGIYGLLCTGLGPGPQGRLVACFDKNGGTSIPLLQQIDAATLAVSPFATPSFTGDNVISTGCYSPLTGRAVVLDTWNDAVRSYAQGESGAGAILVPNTSNPKVSDPGSYGEEGWLFPITLGTAGLVGYGAGAPGCAGAHVLSAVSAPKAGIPGFRFTCTQAPPASLGLLLFGNAPDFAGSDPLAVGVPFYLDLLLSTEIIPLDLASDALGSSATVPFTLPPSAIGLTYYGNAIWGWSSCSLPPFNLSASPGLQVTILP